MRVAGQRVASVGLSVDFADLVRVAVENERATVLRAVREAVDAVKTDKYESDSYRATDRGGSTVKGDIQNAIREVERRLSDGRG